MSNKVYTSFAEVITAVGVLPKRLMKTATTTFVRVSHTVKCGDHAAPLTCTPKDYLALYEDGAWPVSPEDFAASYKVVQKGHVPLLNTVACSFGWILNRYSLEAHVGTGAVTAASFKAIKTAVTYAVQVPVDLLIQSKEGEAPVPVKAGDWVAKSSSDDTVYNFTEAYRLEAYRLLD